MCLYLLISGSCYVKVTIHLPFLQESFLDEPSNYCPIQTFVVATARPLPCNKEHFDNLELIVTFDLHSLK